MVVTTQRPSADVIKGRLKANFPAGIVTKMRDRVNSQIAGVVGAEFLRGSGDALLVPVDDYPQRIQVTTQNRDTIREAVKEASKWPKALTLKNLR